jgi:hypothetical protein
VDAQCQRECATSALIGQRRLLLHTALTDPLGVRMRSTMLLYSRNFTTRAAPGFSVIQLAQQQNIWSWLVPPEL